MHNVRVPAYNSSDPTGSSGGGAAPGSDTLLQVMSGVLVYDSEDSFNALFVPVVLGEPASLHALPSLLQTHDGGSIVLGLGAATVGGYGFTNCSNLAGEISWSDGGFALEHDVTDDSGDSYLGETVQRSASLHPVNDWNMLHPQCSRWQDYPLTPECSAWEMYHPPAATSGVWGEYSLTPSAVCSAIAPSNRRIGTAQAFARLARTELQTSVVVAFSPRLKIAHPASAWGVSEQRTIIAAPTNEHSGVYLETVAGVGAQAGPVIERRWANVRTSHTVLLPLGVAQAVVLQGGPMQLPHSTDFTVERTVRAKLELVNGSASHGLLTKWTKQSHIVPAAQWLQLADNFSPSFELQVQCPSHAVAPTMFKVTTQVESVMPSFAENVFLTVACKVPASVRPRIILPAAHAQEWTVELFEPSIFSRASDNWLQGVEQDVQGTHPLKMQTNTEHRAHTGTQGNAFMANTSSIVMQAAAGGAAGRGPLPVTLCKATCMMTANHPCVLQVKGATKLTSPLAGSLP
jgi:hypothetical protein